ncbi:MAG: hypothetical protein KF699_04150 [Phycisphaeraceae bacterium]|nr:hypothetical protein [Phycisphaeraceae bacterium]MBX3405699.1 hypothetical protein [Phycisphaeraceae bacterium]
MSTKMTKSAAVVGTSAAVLVLASTAGASISDPFLTITAINGAGTDTFIVPLGLTAPGANPGARVYSNGNIALSNGAAVSQLSMTIDPQGPLNTPHDNLISLTFTAWGGATNTTFIITTANLDVSFPQPVLARASSNFAAVDQNGDGVTVTSIDQFGAAAAGWWRTQFNGGYGPNPNAAPFGTQYALNGAGSISTASPFGSVNGGNNTGILSPIGPGWLDMSAQLRFTITPGDSVGGTSTFISSIAIPAPGAAVMLALGGIAAGRRRR